MSRSSIIINTDIHRRSFLASTAAALAGIALPAAAVAAGTPTDADWNALGAELAAGYRDQRRACARATEALIAASEKYPPRPFLPTITIEDDGTWAWDAKTEVSWREDDRLDPVVFGLKAERRYRARIDSAHATALMDGWPRGAAERFEQEGALLWQETSRRIADWQEDCLRIDSAHGIPDRDSEIEAIDTQIDYLQDRILSLPANSLAAVAVKLDLILRYVEDDLWTTTLTKKLRDELREATGSRAA